MDIEVQTRAKPVGARRSRPPRRRRQEILEAAAGVFHAKGYKATSIQDIADAVGILKGSLYYYITSKEDLLFEILEDVHQQGLRNLERIEATPRDAAAADPGLRHAPRQPQRREPGQDGRVLPRLPLAQPRAAQDHRRRARPLRPAPAGADRRGAEGRVRLPRPRPEADLDRDPRDDELDLPVVSAGRLADDRRGRRDDGRLRRLGPRLRSGDAHPGSPARARAAAADPAARSPSPTSTTTRTEAEPAAQPPRSEPSAGSQRPSTAR